MSDHNPRRITSSDLLTWELQMRREGTLPPEVQLRLLEHVANRPVAVALAPGSKVETYEGGHADGYAEGYEAGRGDRLGPG